MLSRPFHFIKILGSKVSDDIQMLVRKLVIFRCDLMVFRLAMEME